MYEQHMQRAARYAALALTERRPAGDEVAALAVYRADLIAALSESLTLLTGLTRDTDRTADLPHLSAHPVQALAARLFDATATGHLEWDDRPAPSERWAGSPRRPEQVDAPAATWKGLAREAVLARYALEPVAARLPDGTRWRCVGDIAVLAEAAATLDTDLVDLWVANPKVRDTWRASAAALATTARETQAVAASPAAAPVPTPQPVGVVIVNDLGRLPAAVDSLGRLLTLEAQRGTGGLGSFTAATTVLAQISLTSADALDTARRVPDVGIPDLLAQASGALRAHGTALADGLRQERPRLGSTATGSAAALTQARELGAAALPRLRDLRARPGRAVEASPALLRYASLAAEVTLRAREHLLALHRTGTLLVRGESENAAYRGWYETLHAGGHDRLLTALDEAAEAARGCPSGPDRPTAPGLARETATTALAQELAQQRGHRRPLHPSLPLTAAPTAGR